VGQPAQAGPKQSTMQKFQSRLPRCARNDQRRPPSLRGNTVTEAIYPAGLSLPVSRLLFNLSSLIFLLYSFL
jgi:hypothetical protein